MVFLKKKLLYVKYINERKITIKLNDVIMNKNKSLGNIIYTSKEKVGCDGGTDFGHPLVYLTFGNKKTIVCPYCSRKYVLKKK
jgi:uncharacterized Zn-finger protein|tara:strand:+ start:288 stop:536 length:249 start_codon:yes stop_codon:yes gene_type:complete